MCSHARPERRRQRHRPILNRRLLPRRNGPVTKPHWRATRGSGSLTSYVTQAKIVFGTRCRFRREFRCFFFKRETMQRREPKKIKLRWQDSGTKQIREVTIDLEALLLRHASLVIPTSRSRALAETRIDPNPPSTKRLVLRQDHQSEEMLTCLGQ